MKNSIQNIMGVAAAVVMLLGVNIATNNSGLDLPDYKLDSDIVRAEDRKVNTLKDFNDAIVDIAEKTNPAVVTITTEKTTKVQQPQVNIPAPFRRYFDIPEEDRSREYTQRGLGSGVLVSEDGFILTNNHVIENTDEIKVRLFNGEEIDAELIGRDPGTDIAVIKVDETDLPSIKLGNSDNAKVGSFVMAIGSPLSEDLAHTVSYGIVSARGRALNLTEYGDYIQTDAAINPGNSGGALIDMNGELIGINSAIASRSGGNDGIGFAIPVNLAKRIMDDLIEDGTITRGSLGLYYAGDVDRTMAKALGLTDARGFIVGQVVDGEAADKAGIQEKDIIVEMNGMPVKDWVNFRTSIASARPGDEITLTIVRDGKRKTIDVILGERVEGESVSNSENVEEDMEETLGFNVMELNSEIRGQLGLSADINGVVVNEVSRSSNAFERGLLRGSVITSVKGSKDRSETKITGVDDFRKEMQRLMNSDDLVLFTTIYNGSKQYVAFEL